MTSLFNIFSNSHTQFIPHDPENTTITFDGKPSPVRPDGVLKHHPDTPDSHYPSMVNHLRIIRLASWDAIQTRPNSGRILEHLRSCLAPAFSQSNPRTPAQVVPPCSGVPENYCVHSSLRKYYNNLTSCIGCYGAYVKHVVEPVDSSKNEHKDNSTNIDNNIQPKLIMSSAPRPLDDIVYADTQIYIPNINHGKVVKVYDADTITVANRISVGGAQSDEIYRFQVRLNGIDSPEIKSKNATTKALAKQARDVLSGMIFGKIVELRNVQLEKYGRLLADVYLGDLHLNEWLVENKYAVRYDGGTKHIPEEWEA